MLLDLSRNGGGLLEDAVRISGFFVAEGAVVGIRGTTERSRLLQDMDDETLYAGPLVVLISRVSASASEILAGRAPGLRPRRDRGRRPDLREGHGAERVPAAAGARRAEGDDGALLPAGRRLDPGLGRGGRRGRALALQPRPVRREAPPALAPAAVGAAVPERRGERGGRGSLAARDAGDDRARCAHAPRSASRATRRSRRFARISRSAPRTTACSRSPRSLKPNAPAEDAGTQAEIDAGVPSGGRRRRHGGGERLGRALPGRAGQADAPARGGAARAQRPGRDPELSRRPRRGQARALSAASLSSAAMSNLPAELKERIESVIQSDRVVLFMKGNRQGPQCGFSAQVVQILDRLVPDYTTVDVLSDPALRDGIKVYSSWPTIPQLYVGGELVGGCDIVKELMASGEIFGTLGLPAPSGAAAVAPAERRRGRRAAAPRGQRRRPRAAPDDRRAPPGGPLLRPRGGRRAARDRERCRALPRPGQRLARRRRRRSTCGPPRAGRPSRSRCRARRRCASSRRRT